MDESKRETKGKMGEQQQSSKSTKETERITKSQGSRKQRQWKQRWKMAEGAAGLIKLLVGPNSPVNHAIRYAA
jgi:hypothetical protein